MLSVEKCDNGENGLALFDEETLYIKQFYIQSENHNLNTKELNNVSLSWEDDKDFIMKDNMHILA